MSSLTFDQIAPAAPSFEALEEGSRAVLAELAGARGIEQAMECVRRWDALRSEVSTWDALVHLRFHQDTQDVERKATREAWDDMKPRWTELEIAVKRALLTHPLRAELEEAVGAQAFALWESDALAFDPAIVEDLVGESKLEAEFTALLASAQIEFRGETETLTTLIRHRQDARRDVRHESTAAMWAWFGENSPTLDRIYADLVELRSGMATKLGLKDFVELGYKRMCRVDYSREDVERFRAQVRDEIVPLCTAIGERQARTLEVDELMAWDAPVHDLAGNPKPKGDLEWMLARSSEMFDAMGAELGGFWGSMNGGGFLDLASRKGKAGGGFCTSFPTHGMPFVFANFNGTKGDVEVLTHEIGHAFQNYSSREQWPSDYHWPTYESAEVHSMSLEFLTWPHMEAFFQDDAARFRRVHLTESITFIPYGTAVDHFQHEIYEQPELTPDQRCELWREMERTYLPGLNWGDVERAAAGARWQAQSHIYTSPFYYIDYVLAQTCALQFWALAEGDRERALEAYVALCGRGGSLPFQALVRSAGLTSPFHEGCLCGVVARARQTLVI